MQKRHINGPAQLKPYNAQAPPRERFCTRSLDVWATSKSSGLILFVYDIVQVILYGLNRPAGTVMIGPG